MGETALNPAGRADGNRKQRGSRSLTGIALCVSRIRPSEKMTLIRDRISSLGQELLRMADFTNPLWNAGARFWLEHRGSAVARAIHSLPGLKLWFLAPPDGNLSYAVRLSSILADHVVIGHAGPLPPHHVGLAFPWRLDHGTDIPDPDASRKLGMYIEYQLRCDGLRRPLPPLVAQQCLFGSVREGISRGLVSYLPASVVFAPLPGQPWPNPSEVLERNGTLPTERRMVYHNPQNPQVPPVEVLTKYEGDPGTLRELPNPISSDQRSEKPLPEPTINANKGFFEFDDPRVPADIWEWNGAAAQWEVLFASLVASGSLTAENDNSLQPLPEALLRVRLPYLSGAPWEVIEELRHREREALSGLRSAMLKACEQLAAVRGPRLEEELKRIQETIVNKGVAEVRKSFKSHRWRSWGKAAGFGVVTGTFYVASYLGMPPLTALVAGGALVRAGIDLALDLRKEASEWLRKARTEMPMYFVWRLGRERHGA